MSDRITEARERLTAWLDSILGDVPIYPADVRTILSLTESPTDDEREPTADQVLDYQRKTGADLRNAANRTSPLAQEPYTSLDLALVRDAAYRAAEDLDRIIPCEFCGWTGPRTQYLGTERIPIAHPDGEHEKDWLPALRRQGPVTDAEVEAAARGLYEFRSGPDDAPWSDLANTFRVSLYPEARNALEAAREVQS